MADPHRESLFHLFDQSYVINLPERKDRLKETEKEIKWLANGSIPESVKIFPAIRPKSKGGWVSVGNRGSLLSHLECLKLAMNDNSINSILLLEDDISFDAELKNSGTLEHIGQSLQDNNWDYCYIGHNLTQNQSYIEIQIKEYTGPLLLAHCLAFNKQRLQPFIDFLSQTCDRPSGHNEGGKMGFDGAINLYRKNNSTKTLIVTPCLAHQRSSRTDLGKEKWFDRTPGLNIAASSYRDAKNRLIHLKKKIFYN